MNGFLRLRHDHRRAAIITTIRCSAFFKLMTLFTGEQTPMRIINRPRKNITIEGRMGQNGRK